MSSSLGEKLVSSYQGELDEPTDFQSLCQMCPHRLGFPGGSDCEESACNAGDPSSIPKLEKSPGKGNGYPLQYSWLENSRDWGVWWATVHGVAKSQTQLSDFTFILLPQWLSKDNRIHCEPGWIKNSYLLTEKGHDKHWWVFDWCG